MSNEALINQIDENIRRSQQFVEMNSALERLKTNKDFLKVVKKGYFEDEAVRLVHLKMDESMQTPERQASILRQIDAIGNFSSFLNTVRFNADQAARNIAVDEATREELLLEMN